MTSVDLVQKLRLLFGKFTPSQARDLVNNMVDEQINQHKLQHLSKWIGNNNISSKKLDETINQLNETKKELLGAIDQAQAEGMNVRLDGSVDITFTK